MVSHCGKQTRLAQISSAAVHRITLWRGQVFPDWVLWTPDWVLKPRKNPQSAGPGDPVKKMTGNESQNKLDWKKQKKKLAWNSKVPSPVIPDGLREQSSHSQRSTLPRTAAPLLCAVMMAPLCATGFYWRLCIPAVDCLQLRTADAKAWKLPCGLFECQEQWLFTLREVCAGGTSSVWSWTSVTRSMFLLLMSTASLSADGWSGSAIWFDLNISQ